MKLLLIGFMAFGLQLHADEVSVTCLRQNYMCISSGECHYSMPDPDFGDKNKITIQQKYADGHGFEFWEGELNYEIPKVATSPAIPFILSVKQDRYTSATPTNYLRATFNMDGVELWSGGSNELHMQYLNPTTKVGFIFDCYVR